MSRSWASSSVVALVALAGCNGLLGLDATVRDRDGDGIPDDLDNCPDVFNPRQFDSDGAGTGDACAVCATPVHADLDGDGFDDGCDVCLGDGPIGADVDGDGIDDGCDPCIAGVSAFHIDANQDGIEDGCEWCMGGGEGIDIDHDGLDDACDRCLNGPPHDEDGDGVEDGCDNCPALANPGQEIATQGDLRGAACATPNAPFLAVFDPFLVAKLGWTDVMPSGWAIGKDELGVTGTGSIAAVRVAVPSSFLATTRLRFTATGPKAEIGFLATSAVGKLACRIGADGALTLEIVAGATDNTTTAPGVDVSGAVTIVVSAVRSGGPLLDTATCTATGADGVAHTTPLVTIPDPVDGWHPGLAATEVTAAFTLFEVASTVQSGPL